MTRTPDAANRDSLLADPKERAAAALRRSRGADRRGKATKESAAQALREYSGGSRQS